MGSTKIYLLTFLFIFSFSVISVSAQTRVQKLYSRSLMDGEKEVSITKSIQLLITGKNLKPLADAKVSIVDYDLIWKTDAEGRVTVVIPVELISENIEIEVYSRRYFFKNIYVSFADEYEINRSIHLKYNHKSRCFRSIVCPNF